MAATAQHAPDRGRAPWAAPRDRLATAVRVLAVLLGLALALLALVGVALLLPADPGGVTEEDRAQAVADLDQTRQTGILLVLACFLAIVVLLVGVLWWSHRRRRRLEFSSPPGWPTMPPGWRPYRGWQPPADWAPAPQGWTFWVERPR